MKKKSVHKKRNNGTNCMQLFDLLIAQEHANHIVFDLISLNTSAL